MTTSFFDVAINWFGSGANAPKVCLPFDLAVTPTHQFGDPDGDTVKDSLALSVPVGAWMCAPMNGMMWQVPDLGGASALPEGVLANWPQLRRLDGTAFAPGAPRGPANFDLLLEVWPTAFRRLEYVLSSLEVPVDPDNWDLPQMPVPRWFCFSGLGELGMRANEIANRHRVGLDETVQALAQTAKDMNSKYKETSEAGLALSVVLC